MNDNIITDVLDYWDMMAWCKKTLDAYFKSNQEARDLLLKYGDLIMRWDGIPDNEDERKIAEEIAEKIKQCDKLAAICGFAKGIW